MSIETANAARFKKGMMALTPLEGELLEALEALDKSYSTLVMQAAAKHCFLASPEGYDVIKASRSAITHAHGASQDCEAP